MARRSGKSSSRRSRRKKSAGSSRKMTAWAINGIIAVLAVVIIGFVYSSIRRMHTNDQAVDLSLEQSIKQYDNQTPAELYEQKRYPDIWVEVLNGNGVAGVAADFTEFLRDEGFDVQVTDNANKFSYPKTLVIDRSDNRKKAVAVAKSLRIDTSTVQTDVNESLQLDVTVILGKDYKSLPVYKQIKQREIP